MYRQEHPNPQFLRDSWVNLNGEWDFEFDFGTSGIERKLYTMDSFSKKINVPFCPESSLSGIEYKDFIPGVWYLKKFTIPAEQKNKRIFIHFGAVDYECHVFINKQEVGTHIGGYTSFQFDITEYIQDGENTICVFAKDDVRSHEQPKGKQAHKFYSSGCDYTRTTGIWQTVWLEFTPKSYIEDFKFFPDVKNQKLGFEIKTKGCENLTVKTSFEGRPTGECTLNACQDTVFGEVALSEKQLWEVGCGKLYDVELVFGEDTVKTYFGLRDVKIDGYKVLINGKSVFQRLVLDQGFYPDGIYTAPTEDDLIKDIKLSLDAGFNGARLHEKVFEPRFLYHCDKLGYIVWGEYPNWGIDHTSPYMLAPYINQWKESVERDFNHPAIIGWCPFNETSPDQYKELLSTVYHITKSWDKTRPCIGTSGYFQVETDIYDVHDYSQNPAELQEHYANLNTGEYTELKDPHQNYNEKKYFGKPFWVSEFGGIAWSMSNEDKIRHGWSGDANAAWGYGKNPTTEEEFIARYKGQTEALLNNPYMFGFCYTQLYDIEQEINGLYTYDRTPKFDMSIFKAINSQKAKIED